MNSKQEEESDSKEEKKNVPITCAIITLSRCAEEIDAESCLFTL